jgi:hypothetical protein
MSVDCSMTNSEFSNFFETFYLQEVNKANRAKFVYVTIRTRGIEARRIRTHFDINK